MNKDKISVALEEFQKKRSLPFYTLVSVSQISSLKILDIAVIQKLTKKKKYKGA
jgi:hypothetical protein